MRIESKSTGLVHFISRESYDKMAAHTKRLYAVIDNSDSIIPSVEVSEVKLTAREVFDVDFTQSEIEKIIEECTKADIKEMLDDQRLEYKSDDNKRVLAEIYYKWKTENY